MCVLKAFSANVSFQSFAKTTAMPIFSVKEKGEISNKKTGSTYGEYRISFDVSDCEWDDLPGQVKDAVAFLVKWEFEIENLKNKYAPDELILDFPLYSRLNEDIVNQNDYLPKELIKIAGRLDLEIGISIYAKDAFEN